MKKSFYVLHRNKQEGGTKTQKSICGAACLLDKYIGESILKSVKTK